MWVISPVFNKQLGRPGNYTDQEGLSNNAVWATLETEDGKIWIGTQNGVNVYDPATESYSTPYSKGRNGLVMGLPYCLRTVRDKCGTGNNASRY
jgi:ligand-binding sensor domain-containing protein